MTIPESKTENGVIVKGLGGLYEIKLDSGARTECRGRGVFRHEKLTLLPGDRVTVKSDPNGSVIDSVSERRSCLLRPAVANLDLMFLIIPASDPEPSLETCDELIAICEYNRIDVRIIVGKSDLDPGFAEKIAGIYEKSGFDVLISGNDVPVSKIKDFVFSACDGRISAFSGASGVGKSTLINRVFPNLFLETGEVSRKTGRGRHTTRKAELYDLSDLTGNKLSGFIADTPGFSMLDFEKFDFFSKDELFGTFREFVPCEGKCRYTKCTHTKEEGCEVLRRVESGIIPKSRHDSYLFLYERLKNKHAWDAKGAK